MPGRSVEAPAQAPTNSAFPGPLSRNERTPIPASLGSKCPGKKLTLERQPIGQGQPEAFIDSALGQPLRHHRTGRQSGGKLHCLGAQRVGRHDPIYQSDPERLLSAQVAPGEDDVLCSRRPDEAGQPLGTPAARDDAEQDLGLAQPGPTGHEPKIARQGQLEASAKGSAGDDGQCGAG